MKQYVIDAFTDKVFGGNPAAVCILDQWPTDELMMLITKENNLSETAFAVKETSQYKLRWFTPGGEVDLCGHATLATAYTIMNFIEPYLEKVDFSTLSGLLTVTREQNLYAMDFPIYDLKEVPITDTMIETIGATPKEAYIARDLLCIFDDEETVRNLQPNLEKLKTIDGLLLHATARGKDYDCVSRSFAPKLNIPEDPVCGSGHCHIIPYWLKNHPTNTLIAYQASSRGGVLYGSIENNRIILKGNAALYSIATLSVE